MNINFGLILRTNKEIPESGLPKPIRVIFNDLSRNKLNRKFALRTLGGKVHYALMTELANNPSPTYIDVARHLTDKKIVKNKTDEQLMELPDFRKLVSTLHKRSNDFEFVTNYLDRNRTGQRGIVPQTDSKGRKIGWTVAATIDQMEQVFTEREKKGKAQVAGLQRGTTMRANVLDGQKSLAAGAGV